MSPDNYAKKLKQNVGKAEAKRISQETLKQAESSNTNVSFWLQVANILKK